LILDVGYFNITKDKPENVVIQPVICVEMQSICDYLNGDDLEQEFDLMLLSADFNVSKKVHSNENFDFIPVSAVCISFSTAFLQPKNPSAGGRALTSIGPVWSLRGSESKGSRRFTRDG
jgi:hypothetical protein